MGSFVAALLRMTFGLRLIGEAESQFSINRNVGTTSLPRTLRSTVAWRTSSERILDAEAESARSWNLSTTER
jgi:hypothetical protein